MNKTQLKYFLAVSECGSLNAAAQVLDVSRTALSQQIKLLQDEFDTELFVRNGRNLQLTPAGDIFVAFARKTLITLRKTEKKISSIKQGFDEMLTIGCSETSLIKDLAKYIAKVTKLYPSIKFRLLYKPLWLLLKMMDSGEIDIIISHHINKDCEFEDKYCVKALKQDKILAIIPPSLNFGKRESISLMELDGRDIIISEKHENTIMDKLAILGVSPRIKCVTKSSYTKIAFVQENIGIAFVTEALRDIIDKEQLKSYYVEELEKIFTEYIFYPRNRKTPAVEKFITAICNKHKSSIQ